MLSLLLMLVTSCAEIKPRQVRWRTIGDPQGMGCPGTQALPGLRVLSAGFMHNCRPVSHVGLWRGFLFTQILRPAAPLQSYFTPKLI